AAAAAAATALVDEDEDEAENPTFLEKLVGKQTIVGMSSVSFSVLVHMIALICLGLWLLPPLLEPPKEIIAMLDVTPQEMVTQTLDTKMTPTSELALTSSSMASQLSGGDGIAGVSEPTYKEAVTQQSDGP